MEHRKLLFIYPSRGSRDQTSEGIFRHLAGYTVESATMHETAKNKIAEADAIFVMTNYQKKMLRKAMGVAKEKIVVLGRTQHDQFNSGRAEYLESVMRIDRPPWLWGEEGICQCGGKTLDVEGTVVCKTCGVAWKREI